MNLGTTGEQVANNIFVIGKNLKKQGMYNDLPDLENLDVNGDLKHEIDFREIYATLLDKWLKVDDAKILNKQFSKLSFV